MTAFSNGVISVLLAPSFTRPKMLVDRGGFLTLPTDVVLTDFAQDLPADGSIMPRVPAGNTMAPCVIIGERAAEMLKAEYGL